MNRNELVESAMRIKPVSEEVANEYSSKQSIIVQKINEAMQNRIDLNELVGETNFEMMKDNHANHVRFIASILKFYKPEQFVDTVLWVFRAYRSRGFHSNYWAAQLNAFIQIMRSELSTQSFDEVYPYYEWMQVNIPTFVLISDEKFEILNSSHINA